MSTEFVAAHTTAKVVRKAEPSPRALVRLTSQLGQACKQQATIMAAAGRAGSAGVA